MSDLDRRPIRKTWASLWRKRRLRRPRRSRFRFTPQPEPVPVWTAVVIGVVLLILLVIFVAQTTEQSAVKFLWLHGRAPTAVVLLIATIAGCLHCDRWWHRPYPAIAQGGEGRERTITVHCIEQRIALVHSL